jgi:hypothetical protein
VTGYLRSVLVVHGSAELYGSDRTLLESVRAMVGHGAAVTVALPCDGPLAGPLRQAGAVVEVAPTAVVRKSALSVPGVLRLVACALRVAPGHLALLRRCAPQLLYVNTVIVPLWIPLARLLGIRVVCHVHEAEDGVPRQVARALVLPLLLAHAVVANSRTAREVLLRSWPRLAGRVEVVYNGVPGPTAAPVSLPEQAPQELRLVLVGRLSHRKGTDVAVAAALALRAGGLPVRLQLVGSAAPGMADLERDLRRAAEASGGCITLAGFQEDVWPCLAAAHVVLVPSRLEPFGNVAVEAALARRPVVVSGVQGLREIVRDGATGLVVPPDDPGALAAAVRRLHADWPTTRRLAADAEADATARFGVRRYATELIAVLETALGRNQRV